MVPLSLFIGSQTNIEKWGVLRVSKDPFRPCEKSLHIDVLSNGVEFLNTFLSYGTRVGGKEKKKIMLKYVEDLEKCIIKVKKKESDKFHRE